MTFFTVLQHTQYFVLKNDLKILFNKTDFSSASKYYFNILSATYYNSATVSCDLNVLQNVRRRPKNYSLYLMPYRLQYQIKPNSKNPAKAVAQFPMQIS